MEIRYKSNRIRKICENVKLAEKTYGTQMTEKLDQRLYEIQAADTVEMLIQFHIGRCHPLGNNRKGQYAVDLVHPYRLVFEKQGKEIQIVQIIEIIDYH